MSLFGVVILASLIFKFSIIYALAAGFLLFAGHALLKGLTFRHVLRLAWNGILTSKNVIITFCMIGVLASLWRASGTIAVIISYVTGLIRPWGMVLMTFWLTAAISFLTGTSFGTSATMGVICAAIASSMGISPILYGGAVMSGSYFGDRCSPMSASVQLIGGLTHTNVYTNMKNMFRSAIFPFLITSAIYLAAGFLSPHSSVVSDVGSILAREYSMHWITLLPAALIIIMSLCRVHVRITMLASIISAVVICFAVQHQTVIDVIKCVIVGFTAKDSEVGALLNGGGLVSMMNVVIIVFLSASFSGIFRETGILDGVKHGVRVLGKKLTPYIAEIIVSYAIALLVCNQTLTMILAHQVCGREDDEPDYVQALTLHDTALVVAPLVPWSIAATVTMTNIDDLNSKTIKEGDVV
ncbi:MAG: sodium:proton antiporter, partial [Oscillospiraceae bacterium]|nr:sodium:proton antiporter [Oscillospiraceae bacterium]